MAYSSMMPPVPEARHPQRSFAWMLVVTLISSIIFVGGVLFGVEGTDAEVLGMACITLVLGTVPIILDQGRRPAERHLFLSFFALVFMAHYVLPAFSTYIPATGPIDAPGMANTNLVPNDILYAQVVALVGYLSLLVGYASPFTRSMARSVPRARMEWPPAFTLIVATGMIPVGVLISVGGQLGAISAALGTGVIGVFGLAYIYANSLLTVLVLRYRWRLPALLIAANVAFSFLFGALTTRKTQMLVSPAIVVLTAALMRGRIRPRWVVLGAIGVILVFPMSEFLKDQLGERRREAIRAPVETLGSIARFVTTADAGQYFVSGLMGAAGRTDALGVSAVLLRDTPSRSPYQYGRTLALFFISFVPRVLWEDKPRVGIGQWITDTYGSGRHISSSTGPSQVGEFYINFGVLGVIGGLFSLGILMRIAQESLLHPPATTPAILVGVILLYNLCIKFDASVAGTYGSVVFLVAPIVLSHLGLRIVKAVRPLPPDVDRIAGSRRLGAPPDRAPVPGAALDPR